MRSAIALFFLVAFSVCTTANAATVEYSCKVTSMVLATPTNGLIKRVEPKDNGEFLYSLSMSTDGTGDVITIRNGNLVMVVEDFVIDRSDDSIRWSLITDFHLAMYTLWTKTGLMHVVVQITGNGLDQDETNLQSATCEVKR